MSAAVDIGLDPLTGDLPDVPVLITGTPLIQQLIGCVLNFFRGEWYLDVDLGLPLLEWVTERGLDLPAVLARVEREIRGVPGVLRTQDATISMSGRTVTIGLVAVTRDGDVTVSLVQSEAGLRNGSPWGVYFAGGVV